MDIGESIGGHRGSGGSRGDRPGGRARVHRRVYSDPGHVFAYSDGEVRQQFSICFACRLVGGEIRVSDESTEVAFFAPADLDQLDVHPSVRLRLEHYVEGRPHAVIG